jgi:hypothetical protein
MLDSRKDVPKMNRAIAAHSFAAIVVTALLSATLMRQAIHFPTAHVAVTVSAAFAA